ncbi:MAG: hypothetical protein R3F62_20985 [Planctomycetota bacterium]
MPSTSRDVPSRSPESRLVQTLELRQIQDYVWSRYVTYEPPAAPLDEGWALERFEAYYAEFPMERDADCAYYGILAFERSYSDSERRSGLLHLALRAFEIHRRLTPHEGAWDAVDDRRRDAEEALKRVRRGRRRPTHHLPSSHGLDTPRPRRTTAHDEGGSHA